MGRGGLGKAQQASTVHCKLSVNGKAFGQADLMLWGSGEGATIWFASPRDFFLFPVLPLYPNL